MPEIVLSGCSPIPLAHYLKALGIHRIVAESGHGDPTAMAFWVGDQFILRSRFNCETLAGFLLNDYSPTPAVAPWNGGSGFFPRDNDEALAALESSKSERLRLLREGITAARTELAKLRLADKPDGESKARLLQNCRNHFPDAALAWLDAVVVLGEEGAKFPPLLGTGGNDGRLEFTNNFMQRITEVVDPVTGLPTPRSAGWLRAALFAEPAPGSVTKSPIGQFFPGAAGGANSTRGFDAPSAVNPWDFILMIEGALLFAAASVKRLDAFGEGVIVYPFCVRQAGVGYASAAAADEADARCEIWLPLWERATSMAELRAIFGEGRAQVRGRPARSGLDFAQATMTLGVDRGIGAFQRIGFQVRNGLSYFAIPLERITVRRCTRADLLADIEEWHDRLRLKSAGGAGTKAPASIVRALNQLERSILLLCRDGGRGTMLNILASLGTVERALARSLKWAEENCIPPLHGLSQRWLSETDDGSAEFHLASALASVRAPLGLQSLWFRQHLEPVEMGSTKGRSWVKWAENRGNEVVWQEGALTDTLNRILARRLMRFGEAGVDGWPDIGPRTARLDGIAAFIEGRLNESLLADLLWALSCVGDLQASAHSDAPHDQPSSSAEESGIAPSAFYALLKLCHHRRTCTADPIPLVPAILHRTMKGDGGAASELAARRLCASGFHPLIRRLPVSGEAARRTAASMLFPISNAAYQELTRTITHNNQIIT